MNKYFFIRRLLLVPLVLVIFLVSFLFSPQSSEAASYVIKTNAAINGGTAAGANQKKLVRTSNGDYHTVYTYSDGSFVQVFYAKSTDGGQTWTETQLTNAAYAQNRPSIAVDSSDNLHVVWWGKDAASTGFNQIRYMKYSNGAWSSITDLTSGNYEQNQSSFAIDGNDNIHVVWQGVDAASPSTNQIRYIKYSGGGWGSITDLTTNTLYAQQRPYLGIDYNNDIHVTWFGYNAVHTTKNQIRYIKYSGGSWGSIVELTDEADDQNYPSLAFDLANNVHLVWQHVVLPSASSDKHIYYLKYTVGTNSWSTALDISGSGYTLGQWNPKIAVDSHDYLHVTWNGSDATSTNWNIFHILYNGSWGSITNLTPDNIANEQPNPVWSPSPIIKNVKVGRAQDGYAFTYTAGTSYKFYASSDLAWDVATPPVLSAGSPSGTLSSLTTNVTLTVTTDENSTCKYDTSSGTAYASMPHTFTTTGGTSHSISVQVTNNASYTYYVRCFGPYTAFNTSDYTISFSVAKPPSGHPPVMIPPIFLPPVVAQPAPETPSVAPSNTPSVALPTPLVITKNYQLKDKSEDIKLLQQWLNANGFTIAKNGAGSKGKETTLFGSLTKKALMQYQKSKGIPATGFLGPITRKSLNL